MGVLGYKWRIQAICEHALGQFPHSISFAFCQAFGVTFFLRSCQLICPVSFGCHILNVFGTNLLISAELNNKSKISPFNSWGRSSISGMFFKA